MFRSLSTYGLACAGALSISCREPTQVTLDLTTDAECGDLNEVQIAVSSLGAFDDVPPSATSNSCTAGSTNLKRIGDIVVVPQKDKRQNFAVQIVVGVAQSTEKCLSNGFKGGCIVARRALSFQPHVPLTLPIELEVSCIDIPCGATETCRGGGCVSATLDDPESCSIPGGCDDTGSPQGTGGADGSGGTGGSDSTGGSEASGGAENTGGMDGAGGTAEPGCGNGNLEPPEACDDDNLVDGDSCSADCREEYLIAVDAGASELMLLDRMTGSIVRKFAGAPSAEAFQPLFVLQLPSSEVLVSDTTTGSIFRYDVHGTYVDTPISGNFNLRKPDFQRGDVIIATGPSGIYAHDRTTLMPQGIVAISDDAFGLEVVDERWFVSAGPSYGEVSLFDRDQIAAPPMLLFDGAAVFDLHFPGTDRLVVPDVGGNVVRELLSSTTPAAGEPFGRPMVAGRSVDIQSPFSVFELNDGSWLISSDAGLGTYDPNTNGLIESKSSNTYRGIESYVGPL